MSSTLSNLYSQYLILSKTYLQAIQEYNEENSKNIKTNVILNLNNELKKTFYIGKFDNLSKYFDDTLIIKSIDIYDGLLVTLYKETSCTGENISYMNTSISSYTNYEINNSYKSMQVELMDKNFDSYPGKRFSHLPSSINNKTNNSEECAKECINKNCTAAVFNSSFNSCSIFTTPGTLEKGTIEDETIIPINKRKLLIITELNAKLKNITEQIHINSVVVLNENKLSLQEKQITLSEYYKKKKEIEDLQSQLNHEKEIYQSLETELTNSSSIIIKNINFYYLMWIFLIFLIFMIFKNIFKPNKTNPGMLTWIILIICIISSFSFK